ncbi:hypothetical protein LXL04_034238 [Taraxacum kok-saghyz]
MDHNPTSDIDPLSNGKRRSRLRWWASFGELLPTVEALSRRGILVHSPTAASVASTWSVLITFLLTVSSPRRFGSGYGDGAGCLIDASPTLGSSSISPPTPPPLPSFFLGLTHGQHSRSSRATKATGDHLFCVQPLPRTRKPSGQSFPSEIAHEPPGKLLQVAVIEGGDTHVDLLAATTTAIGDCDNGGIERLNHEQKKTIDYFFKPVHDPQVHSVANNIGEVEDEPIYVEPEEIRKVEKEPINTEHEEIDQGLAWNNEMCMHMHAWT